MSSINNYSFPCPNPLTITPPGGKPQKQAKANDLHISQAGGGKITVIGVEGVGTDDPKAPFGVDNQGTNAVDITGISVNPGDSLHMRLKIDPGGKGAGNKVTFNWTVNGTPVDDPPKAIDPVTALVPGEGGGEDNAGLLDQIDRLKAALDSIKEKVVPLC